MGLNAVVYRNRKHLKLGPDELAAQFDAVTGEIYFKESAFSCRHRAQLQAVHHRLGNIALIDLLRAEVAELLGPDSFIVQKVLYSGSHSGDTVSLEFLPALSADLHSISTSKRRSPELREFAASVKDLIENAKNENNPIVFV